MLTYTPDRVREPTEDLSLETYLRLLGDTVDQPVGDVASTGEIPAADLELMVNGPAKLTPANFGQTKPPEIVFDAGAPSEMSIIGSMASVLGYRALSNDMADRSSAFTEAMRTGDCVAAATAIRVVDGTLVLQMLTVIATNAGAVLPPSSLRRRPKIIVPIGAGQFATPGGGLLAGGKHEVGDVLPTRLPMQIKFMGGYRVPGRLFAAFGGVFDIADAP